MNKKQISLLWAKHNTQLLILLHHVFLIGGISYYGFNLAYFVLFYSIAMLYAWLVSSEIGHYHFAHGKYYDSTKNYFYSILLLLSGLGSPISFSLMHRLHHRYVDTDRDPHSPKHIGWVRTYFLFWNTDNITVNVIKDLITSKFQMFIHDNRFSLHILILTILACIDIRLVCFLISSIVVYTFHTSGAINVLGHLNGQSRNAPETMWMQFWGWKHHTHHLNK